MDPFPDAVPRSLHQKLRTAFVGPQLVAFLPALMLGAFWFGGEGLLLFVALIFPAALVLGGVTGTSDRRERWPADAVTGLPLRKSLLGHLERGLNRARRGIGHDPVCIVLAIDDARQLRARHGHVAADHIMRVCADRLKGMLRPEDLVVSLDYGKFAMALRGGKRMDLESVIAITARLQDAVTQPYSVDAARILVTASVGFVLPSRAPSQTAEGYLLAAENALEAAEQSGPGSIRAFSASMHRPRASTAFAADELVNALENGEITAWFQPQISTDTGELTGFEALARWIHPQKGQVAPAVFLPAIQAAGLLERLGEIMLFQSLTALRNWERAGLKVPNVAINLSAEELRNPKLQDKIRWELDRFEIAPGRLTLEILENVVADSGDDTCTRNIAALSRLGCRIDLDDFGTGHASITNIRRFDVHRIKIDRSFITHVDTDRDQQDMVAAILTMAERLGVETLGEGVETPGEHAMLAQLGCDHVQGYSIGRPMPFSDTASWILDHAGKLPQAFPLKKPA
ncbi:MAG TPA: GGDEF domain-containing protein [Aliiroseovarius sp.]|nr:GGDEF domain-containing protein [Aliiroseovarius sp.]